MTMFRKITTFLSGLIVVAAATPAGAQQIAGGFSWDAETRWRYETLDGQFRGGRGGSDQALSVRSRLNLYQAGERWRAHLELVDSRVFLDDAGSTVSTSHVNTADVLQAYITREFDGGDIQIGRFTLNVGTRRLVGRNGFRNTINAFTGVRGNWSGENWQATAFYTVPVDKRPSDRGSLGDNDHAFDRENHDLHFWGGHARWALADRDIQLDAFLYGLNESESAERDIYTPGLRVYRAPSAGHWDFEVELAHQFGERLESSTAGAPVVDVAAQMAHFEIGYRFDHDWAFRVSAELEYATGDDQAGDGDWQRFDPMFGLRRRDFGQTGIHGPLRRQNVVAPGLRLTWQPDDRFDGRLLWKAAWLESGTDVWRDAGLRDVTGQSSEFLGHHLDTRLRYWLRPGKIRLETGAGLFIAGDFTDTAAPSTAPDNSLYSYVMITAGF